MPPRPVHTLALVRLQRVYAKHGRWLDTIAACSCGCQRRGGYRPAAGSPAVSVDDWGWGRQQRRCALVLLLQHRVLALRPRSVRVLRQTHAIAEVDAQQQAVIHHLHCAQELRISVDLADERRVDGGLQQELRGCVGLMVWDFSRCIGGCLYQPTSRGRGRRRVASGIVGGLGIQRPTCKSKSKSLKMVLGSLGSTLAPVVRPSVLPFRSNFLWIYNT